MSKTLTSWKEIAAYLGKGVRTVQRWEEQFGLPVRRPSADSHIIFALPEELDAWVKRQQMAPNHRPGDPLEATKKERLKQHELLSRLRTSSTRLEANERVLGKNVHRLLEGFRANPLNGKPKHSGESGAEGQRGPNSRKIQSKGAA